MTSPWPRLICLMLIVGIIAGLELEAMHAGLDGVALSVSIGSIGAIAGVIGGRIFPLKRISRGGPGAER